MACGRRATCLPWAGGITPASAEREGLRHFKMRAYGAAAAWFELACGKAPTADRCFRLATARVGANDLLGAAIALRAALRANPKHLPSLSAWPRVARSLRAAGAGGLNVKMTDESSETMVRRVAKAILADDLLLAEQLASAAIKAGHKGRVLRWLRAETRVRAGHFTWASKDLDALSKGAAGAPHQARDLRAAIAIHLQQWDAARGMLKLAAPPAAPEGRRLPDAVDVHTDLKSFLRWRRSASDHQLRRLLDAGMRPYPAFEAPVFFNPESVKRWPRMRRGTGASSRFSGKRRRRR